MQWQLGGNFEPVRIICELDWRQCPKAIANYVWNEIVTDVLDCLINEELMYRVLLTLLACLMCLHVIYCKVKHSKPHMHDKEILHKVGYKVEDLELKVNILTYKMQYGTWPLPHQIKSGLKKSLRNVRLTLSSPNDYNDWIKQALLRKDSKVSKSENLELQQYRNAILPRETRSISRRLLCRSSSSSTGNLNRYEKYARTLDECKWFLKELHSSNKSLGLAYSSSQISEASTNKSIWMDEESRLFPSSEERSVKNAATEIDENGHGEMARNADAQEAVKLDDTDTENRSVAEDPIKELIKTGPRTLGSRLNVATFSTDTFHRVPIKDVLLPSTYERCRVIEKSEETLSQVKSKLESLHNVLRAYEMQNRRVDEGRSVTGCSKVQNVSYNVMTVLASIVSEIENLNGKRRSRVNFRIASKNGGSKNRRERERTDKSFIIHCPPKSRVQPRNPNILSDARKTAVPDQSHCNLNGLTRRNEEDFFGNLPKVQRDQCTENTNEETPSNGDCSAPMDTEEDLISLDSSKTQLSRDSESEEKSTAILLQEALQFRKELMQRAGLLNLKNSSSKNEEEDDASQVNEELFESECLDTNNNSSSKLDILMEENSSRGSTVQTYACLKAETKESECSLKMDQDPLEMKDDEIDTSSVDREYDLNDTFEYEDEENMNILKTESDEKLGEQDSLNFFDDLCKDGNTEIVKEIEVNANTENGEICDENSLECDSSVNLKRNLGMCSLVGGIKNANDSSNLEPPASEESLNEIELSPRKEDIGSTEVNLEDNQECIEVLKDGGEAATFKDETQAEISKDEVHHSGTMQSSKVAATEKSIVTRGRRARKPVQHTVRPKVEGNASLKNLNTRDLSLESVRGLKHHLHRKRSLSEVNVRTDESMKSESPRSCEFTACHRAENKLKVNSMMTVRKQSSRSCIPVLKTRLEAGRYTRNEIPPKGPTKGPVTLTMLWKDNFRGKHLNVNEEIIRAEGSPANRNQYAGSGQEDGCPNKGYSLKCNMIENINEMCTARNTEHMVIYVNIFTKCDSSVTGILDPIKFLEYAKYRETRNRNGAFIESQTSVSQANGRNGPLYFTERDDNPICKTVTIASSVIHQNEPGDENVTSPSFSIREIFSVDPESRSTFKKLYLLTVKQREVDVTAKPSVVDTSTSISDLADDTAKPGEDILNKLQTRGIPKELDKEEYMALLEILHQEPNFTHLQELQNLCTTLISKYREPK